MQANVFVHVKVYCDECDTSLTQDIRLDDLHDRFSLRRNETELRCATGKHSAKASLIEISYPEHWGGLADVLNTMDSRHVGLFSLAMYIAYNDVEMDQDEWDLFVRFVEQTKNPSIQTFKDSNLGVFESVEDFKQRYLVNDFVQQLDKIDLLTPAIDIDKLFDVIKDEIAIVPFKGKVVVFDQKSTLRIYLKLFSY